MTSERIKVMPKNLSAQTQNYKLLTQEQVTFYEDNGYLVVNNLSTYNHLNMYNLSAQSQNDQLLTREQVTFYEDNGYLIVKNLFTYNHLNIYKKRFIELCNGVDRGHVSFVKDRALYKKGLKPEDYINKIQELLHDEVYMTYSENPQLLHIVSRFLGEDITAVNCMLINKPPGTPRHPPHQDLYYFPFRPAEKIIAVWTAIDAVNVDNGCLYVVPGSHKAKVLYEHGDHLKETTHLYHGIVDEEIAAPINKRVNLVMNPGDTVFFHPYLVHGSGANISKNYRKAITCHYANSTCEYIDVKGTTQELLATQIEEKLRRMGGELSFVDMWKVKCKQVKGVRSNL